MKPPGPPNAIPPPAGGEDGGLLVGSGNVVKPWRRMHCARCSNASLRVSDVPPLPGPPPGSKLPQLFCAAWKAGEAGLIPELELIWMPPPELGSGKFGTPCDRMQSEYLIPIACPFEDDVVLGLLEDPQAASASAHPRPTAAVG